MVVHRFLVFILLRDMRQATGHGYLRELGRWCRDVAVAISVVACGGESCSGFGRVRAVWSHAAQTRVDVVRVWTYWTRYDASAGCHDRFAEGVVELRSAGVGNGSVANGADGTEMLHILILVGEGRDITKTSDVVW